MRRSQNRCALVAAAALGLSAVMVDDAFSQVTASAVVSPSSGFSADFPNASAALGLPSRTHRNWEDTMDLALTPFEPNFGASDIVQIDPGGTLTLQLSGPVKVSADATLGVITNVGLIDASGWPGLGYEHLPLGSGQTSDPTGTFAEFPQAILSVSQDGVNFVPVEIGLTTFDIPANGWTDVPPYDNFAPPPGTTPSDFFKPFTEPLSAFNGLSYAQMVDLLDGSGGGKWFSLAGTGLSEVNFVRFEVPIDVPLGTRMVVDAVVGIAAVSMPEPGFASLAAASVLLLARRRR
jgi:hypothetical protein